MATVKTLYMSSTEIYSLPDAVTRFIKDEARLNLFRFARKPI